LNRSTRDGEIGNGTAYCCALGQALSLQQMTERRGDDGGPAADPRGPEPPASAGAAGFSYAGFWLRLAAYVLDSLLLGLTAGVAVFMPLMSRGAIPVDNPWEVYTGTTPQFFALRLLILMIQWVYFALLESSPWQASLGKRMLGLKVTDLEGRRISFGRASARYFCTLLSGFILMIGFIMIAFTQKKQALHDILTGCLVIKSV
jgi:uncharacterized RDD family membrane protein YckC